MTESVRTNVVIDEELMERAKRLTGIATKRAVVDEALRTLIRFKEQEGVRSLRGALSWEGDLDELRGGRVDDLR